MKNTLITLASVATLACSANAQTVFSMQDSTMSASSFTLDQTDLSGSATSGSGTLASVATGGNGGSYLQMTNTFTTSSSANGAIFNYYLRNGWSFDPSALTAAEFSKLKFYGSVDRRALSGGHVSAVFLKQAGNHFILASDSTAPSSWVNLSGSNSFSGITQNGGVIEMGIRGANSAVRADTFNYSSGYDNLSVIATVPEPSSTALLGLGGLALILRRRK